MGFQCDCPFDYDGFGVSFTFKGKHLQQQWDWAASTSIGKTIRIFYITWTTLWPGLSMQMETDCPRRGWEALSIEMASGHGGLAGALGRWEVQNLSEAGRELNLPLEALKGLGHHLQKSLSFFFGFRYLWSSAAANLWSTRMGSYLRWKILKTRYSVSLTSLQRSSNKEQFSWVSKRLTEPMYPPGTADCCWGV